ncbi:unnamed protein product [Chironomus riparius]|uniref:Uncharacterized protein n=1 Tax=Chironomus riparius TaxID=315576 RepID=A0A9N9RJN5_9DIPT|nr:unnamed protein product [Chironomus riparius]
MFLKWQSEKTMRKNIKHFLLLLFILIGVNCDESTFDKECLADYLKRNGILESSFASAPYINSTELCDQLMIKLVSDFNNDVNRRIHNENLMENQECIIENFEKHGIVKFYLKAFVFQLYGKIPNFKRKSSATKNKFISMLDKSCHPDIFGKEFDLIRGSPTTPDENIACIQKAYFEANILNFNEFRIDLSKFKMPNCTTEAQEFSIPPLIQRDYFGLSAQRVKRCYKNYFLKKQVSLRMATSVVFKNVDLSSDQIAIIRNKYHVWMTENQNAIFTCINKHI